MKLFLSLLLALSFARAEASPGDSTASPTMVGEIRIEGNRALETRSLLSWMDTREGTTLVPAVLEADIDRMLTAYETAGYPFARTTVTDVSPLLRDSTVLRVDLRIEEGPRVTLDEVRVEGNSETRADVILREVPLLPGEIYNKTKVDGIAPRLSRLNIFSRVDDPELYLRPDGTG